MRGHRYLPPAWSKDVATDPNGSRECINLVTSADKPFYPVEGGYHSILDDAPAIRDQVLPVMLTWIEHQL